MPEIKKGDRVKYTGPAVNEAWDVERLGTVTGVTRSGRIDIRWDHGATNLAHDPEHFSTVVSS